METRPSEAEAVARTRQGDAAAFGSLVDVHQEAAFRAAYLVLHDAQAAEDVAQEGFVRAYTNLGRFRAGEPFRPWLLRIVTNLALNELRTRGRRAGLLERVGRLLPREPSPPADAPLVATEAGAKVWQALGRLKEPERQVLYLRYFLELDETELARAIDRPAGTVKSRLHRASQHLRRVIEREYPELREAHD